MSTNNLHKILDLINELNLLKEEIKMLCNSDKNYSSVIESHLSLLHSIIERKNLKKLQPTINEVTKLIERIENDCWGSSYGNYVKRVSKFGSKRIKEELNEMEHSRLSRYEKDHIINKMYYKLKPIKRKRVFGFNKFHFGNTPPTTVAPTTVAPTTIAPTTVAPTTVAPTTIAPTTVAPTTQPPTTQPPVTQPPVTQPIQQASIVTSTNPYGQLAGAVQTLEQAAQGLLDTAAAQNISGFGYYY